MPYRVLKVAEMLAFFWLSLASYASGLDYKHVIHSGERRFLPTKQKDQAQTAGEGRGRDRDHVPYRLFFFVGMRVAPVARNGRGREMSGGTALAERKRWRCAILFGVRHSSHLPRPFIGDGAPFCATSAPLRKREWRTQLLEEGMGLLGGAWLTDTHSQPCQGGLSPTNQGDLDE